MYCFGNILTLLFPPFLHKFQDFPLVGTLNIREKKRVRDRSRYRALLQSIESVIYL